VTPPRPSGSVAILALLRGEPGRWWLARDLAPAAAADPGIASARLCDLRRRGLAESRRSPVRGQGTRYEWRAAGERP
jgi:hypothetical protein